jgi:hypothetical protein
MTAELVEGRCHIPLDSGIRRNDEILILITGLGFDEACLSCLQAVDELLTPKLEFINRHVSVPNLMVRL